MPVSVIEPHTGQWERSNTSNISAKWERELHVSINDLQRHKVMFLIVTTIVEQHAIRLFCRKSTMNSEFVFVWNMYQSANTVLCPSLTTSTLYLLWLLITGTW